MPSGKRVNRELDGPISRSSRLGGAEPFSCKDEDQYARGGEGREGRQRYLVRTARISVMFSI